MDLWQSQNQLPQEIVLSGGEPTLHPQVADIAQLCHSYGVYVSMDSHGGHPERLRNVLPYLHELKLHIDSFDEQEQFDSMGIKLAPVLKSIDAAKQYPLTLLVNHPMQSVTQTSAFIEQAQMIGIDCKIIEVLDRTVQLSSGCVLNDMNWQAMGYVSDNASVWTHPSGHRLFHKRCGTEHQTVHTLYIDAKVVKEGLNGRIVQTIALNK
jgi:organic radical activating enzyme